MYKIYENIKTIRTSLGMSQATLAEKMGYSDKGMISRIEAGKVDLSYSKILKFAEVLRTTPENLMGFSGADSVSELILTDREKVILNLSANCDEAHYESAVLSLKDGQLPSEQND